MAPVIVVDEKTGAEASFACRGVGGSNVRGFVAAVNAIHDQCRVAGFTPVNRDGEVRSMIQSVAPRGKFAKAAAGAVSFEVHVVLPIMRAALGDLKMSAIEKQQLWSMVLESFAHLLRPGEVTVHCRLTTDFELPANDGAWDADGFPKYVVDAFRTSKTSGQGSDYSVYKMASSRNYHDPDYCPVTQKLLYISKAAEYGLDMSKTGPIYPRMGDDGRFVQPVRREMVTGENGTHYLWLDAGGKAVNWSPDQWKRKLKALFHATAERVPNPTTPSGILLRDLLLEATPYSIRKSAVKWAIYSGATVWQLDHAGRWATNSPHRAQYIQDGSFCQHFEDADVGIRQIVSVWSFKPVTWVGLNSLTALDEHIFSSRQLV
jgi:hypothetical protein